jgi:hypothetical protein
MTPEERENYKKQKKQAWKTKRQEEMKEKKKVCVLDADFNIIFIIPCIQS